MVLDDQCGGAGRIGNRDAHGFRQVECLSWYAYQFLARSLKRWILPVAVLGSSATNSIQRGYLKGARRSFTCCLSASASASLGSTPGRVTTKAFGLIKVCSSSAPITAASSTSGWVTRAASTSNGETYIPLTFSMSSERPPYV